MVKQRETFILRYDFYPQIKLLSTERRGILLTAIFAYSMGDPMPEMDEMTSMCFGFIRASLDANTERYEAICERNRANSIRSERSPRKASAASENRPHSQTKRSLVFEPSGSQTLPPERSGSQTLPPEASGSQTLPPEAKQQSLMPIDSDSDLDSDLDSDSDPDSVSVSESVSESGPEPAERVEFLKILLFGKCLLDAPAELDRFWTHYEKTGWVDANGNPIRSREAALRAWSPAKDAQQMRPLWVNTWCKIYENLVKSGIRQTECLPLLSQFRGFYHEDETLHILATGRELMDCLEQPNRMRFIRPVLYAQFPDYKNLNYRIAKS